MIQFMHNSSNPELSSLITFWQFVRATGMDYNEFKSKMWFNNKDEDKIRKIWNKIHDGNVKYEMLEKDYFEKKLDNGTKSLYDYIDAFLKVIYEAQTGIRMDNMMSKVKGYNDIMDWDNDRLFDVFDSFHQSMPEVPFITKLLGFGDNKKLTHPGYVYITSIERKVPGGPFTIREYDSTKDGPEEYQAHEPCCPLVYEWIKGDGTGLQKPGNLKT